MKKELYNSKQVKDTLQELVWILNSVGVEYRLLGSVVTAAINGDLHRRLGDVDLVIDKKYKDQVYKSLKKTGYRRAGGMFAFGRKFLALETLVHPKLQSVGYFWGEWNENGDFFMGNKLVNVRIEGRGVKKTNYSLLGINFIGIPESAIATGIIISKQNSKRKKEIQLLTDKGIKPLRNNYIHVRVLGLPLDWMYHGIMAFLNFLGSIRQKLGLPFDPWRSKIH